jgi:6-phosphogluconolactonase
MDSSTVQPDLNHNSPSAPASQPESGLQAFGGTSTRIADVEKQLSALWAQVAELGEEAILRASTMNLIIYVEDAARADRLLSHVPESHPGRLIIVALDRTITGAAISAEPTVVCRPQFGRVMRQSVCGEQITLRLGPAALEKIANTVQSLLLPDHVTSLLWLAPLKPDHPLLTGLEELSGGLIVDSAEFTDPAADLAAFEQLRRSQTLLADYYDMNWQRLLPYCQAVALGFDPPKARALIPAINTISIDHHGGEAQALLLLGWLSNRLGWTLGHRSGAERWTMRSAHGTVTVTFHNRAVGRAGIQAIQIGTTTGEGQFKLAYEDQDNCIVTQFDGASVVRIAPDSSPSALLDMILSITGPDHLFEEALSTAAGALETANTWKAQLLVPGDQAALMHTAATNIVALARQAIAQYGRFTWALSGGTTPEALFALLATEQFRDDIEWPKVHIFWGDERNVPLDHPDSNQRMAHAALLDHVPIPAENIHGVAAGTADPATTAMQYAATLRQFFSLADGALPAFDLILLGLGDDGHTASLFPHSAGLHAPDSALFIANEVPRLNTTRLTLTFGVINAAHAVYILAAGAKKAAIMETIFGSLQPEDYPVQRVAPHSGRLTLLADTAAASHVLHLQSPM